MVLTPLSGSAGIAKPLAVFFEDLRVTQDVSGDPIRTELNGDISSACFGGDTVTLATPDPLLTPVGEGCPTAGTIKLLTESGVPAAIVHMSDGSVGSDNDADGEIDEFFPTCFDPALFVCPAGGL